MKRFLPSLQMTELMHSLGSGLNEPEVLGRALETGFYRAVETSVLDEGAKARAFYTLCREHGIFWNSWASFAIYGEGLSLGSLDKALRRRSLDRVLELLNRAAQQGADSFSVLSGPRPANDNDLPEAIAIATDSMCELARRMKQYGDMRLLIEPLDRDVHKKAIVGTAAEGAALIRAARQEHAHVYMVWDSAHMALQEGDLSASLRDAGDTVGHIHLCNAVIDTEDPLYGDFHPMPGGRGYLDEKCAAGILRDAAKLELLLPNVPVAVEARPEGDPWAAEAIMRAFLKRALEGACAL